MNAALPYLKMPVLLVQSRADDLIPANSLDQINQKIPSHFKQTLWLDGLNHGMTLDPARDVLFEKITEFLQNLML
jgi:esterase/lipase